MDEGDDFVPQMQSQQQQLKKTELQLRAVACTTKEVNSGSVDSNPTCGRSAVLFESAERCLLLLLFKLVFRPRNKGEHSTGFSAYEIIPCILRQKMRVSLLLRFRVTDSVRHVVNNKWKTTHYTVVPRENDPRWKGEAFSFFALLINFLN